MRTPEQPAICILCAPLPASRDFPPAFTVPADRPSLTISWYGSLDQLGAWQDSEQPPAILIDPATASSRRELRSILQAGRQAVPRPQAAVIEGDRSVPQPDLLVEEGLAVVLTSQFSSAGRPRRPAPAGWPCRSVQWGSGRCYDTIIRLQDRGEQNCSNLGQFRGLAPECSPQSTQPLQRAAWTAGD